MTHTHIYIYTRVEMHACIYYIDMDAAHITRMCQNGQPKKVCQSFGCQEAVGKSLLMIPSGKLT